MREVVILFLHLIVTVVRLARPGGLRSVVAEFTFWREPVAQFFESVLNEDDLRHRIRRAVAEFRHQEVLSVGRHYGISELAYNGIFLQKRCLCFVSLW